MRNIESAEEKLKKENRKKVILGVILIGILVLSSLGYFFKPVSVDSENLVEYKGTKFELGSDGRWHANINGIETATVFNPTETENFSVPFISLQQYSGDILYLDSDNRELESEIVTNLGNIISRAQYACVDEENCIEDLPIKNCTESNVVVIKKSNEEKIYSEEKCVFIEHNNDVKIADAFLFKLFKLN